jgi:uroporphyrinogen-III synthase
VLEPLGFFVDSVILYRAVATQEFSETLRSLIAQGHISGALFFSARTADIYAALVEKHALVKAHSLMDAACMSETIAESLHTLPWRSIHIADRPDMEHMLKTAAKAF